VFLNYEKDAKALMKQNPIIRSVFSRSKLSPVKLSVFAMVFLLLGVSVILKSFASNPNLPGDLNNDNTVNITDLSILLSSYGGVNVNADLNNDGSIGIIDLSLLLSHYNTSYSPPTGFIHQSGTQLLDEHNKPIKLKGVDFGGWLIWEGWIWSQGFDYIGETPIMNNLASLVGQARADQFREDVRNNFIREADVQAVSSYGLNVIRVPINHKLLEQQTPPYNIRTQGWTVLDNVIAWSKKYNVHVVLDMHAAPCGQMFAFVSDWTGPDYFWWNQQCKDRYYNLWTAIADRYKNETTVAGYDLLGETIAGDAELTDLYQHATTAIRSVDKNHAIIYEGNNMARDFDFMTAKFDSNQILSAHDYAWAFPGEDISVRIANKYEAASERLNSPMYIGEFGESTYQDDDKYVKDFNASSSIQAWTEWTWKASPGFAVLRTINHTPASQKLIFWLMNMTRPQPTPAEAEQGMNDFINQIKFENTTFDPQLKSILAQ
jgi:endoglucanase